VSNVTYSPSHRQTGAPMINIQSTLRTAPICVRKYVSLHYYLVATVNHIQSVHSQTCVHIYTCSSQCRDAGRAKEIKKHWGSRMPRKPFSVPFGYACHRFVSPGLLYLANVSKRRTQYPPAHVQSTTEHYSVRATCTKGTRDLRQPHAALEQRFGTPDGSDGRVREHGSELFWFHKKKNRDFLNSRQLPAFLWGLFCTVTAAIWQLPRHK